MLIIDWYNENKLKCTSNTQEHLHFCEQHKAPDLTLHPAQSSILKGLGLLWSIQSTSWLSVVSESDSWQTDMQFYMVFSETIPFLLKHSASLISCMPQDCFLFWVRASVVCFKSLAWDYIEPSPLKSKVIIHHPAFQVLFFSIKLIDLTISSAKKCNFKVTALQLVPCWDWHNTLCSI